MAVVGEAKVVIRAIVDKIDSDIKNAFDRASVNLGGSGEKAGNRYSDGINKSVKQNTGKITGTITESVSEGGERGGREAGRKAADSINRELKRSSRGLERTAEDLGKRIGSSAGRGFQRSRFTRIMGSALVKLGIFIPVIGALVGGISALVSGLYALVAVTGTATASLISLVGYLGAGIQGIVGMVVAFQGVGDAISEGLKPDNAEKFNEALEKISPTARKFVKEFVSLKDEFKAIRDSAAKGLFGGPTGLTNSLRRIEPLLGPIADGFERTGRAVATAIDHITTDLTDTVFGENFRDVADTNNAVIVDMGSSIGDLTRSLVGLLDAAGPLTLRFSAWIRDGSESLREMIEEGNRTGELEEYFNKAGDAAALLGDIFGNIFEGLHDIGKLAYPVGIELFEAFESVTQGMADFTDSAENVKKAEKYFDDIAVNVKAVGNLVKDLGGAFIRMGAAPGVAKTAEAISKIIPDLEKALTTSMESIGPAIAELVGKIAELFTAIEESGAVTAFIKVFSEVASALKTLVNIPILGDFLMKLLQFVAVMKALGLVMKAGSWAIGASNFRKLGNAIETVQIQSMGVYSRTLKLRDSIRSIGGPIQTASNRVLNLGDRFRSTAIYMGASTKVADRVGNSAIRVGNAFGTGIDKVKKFGKSFGKPLATIGLMGAAVTGVADKVGLQNAAMGASAGLMVGGPWGAAILGGIGLVADLRSGYIDTNKVLNDFNTAIKSRNLEEASRNLELLRQKHEELQDQASSSGFKDRLQDALTEVKQWSHLDFSDAQEELKKVGEQTGQAAAEFKELNFQAGLTNDAVNGIDFNINYQKAKVDFNKFFKELKDNTTLNLDIRTPEGAINVQSIKDFADAARSANKDMDQVASTISTKLQNAGFPVDQATVFAKAISGVKLDFDDLTEGKKFTITPDLAALIDGLDDTQFKINEIVGEHNMGVEIDARAANKQTEDVLTGTWLSQYGPGGTPVTIPIDSDATEFNVGLSEILFGATTNPAVVPVKGDKTLINNDIISIRNTPMPTLMSVFDAIRNPFDSVLSSVNNSDPDDKVSKIDGDPKGFNDAKAKIDRAKIAGKSVGITARLTNAGSLAAQALGKIFGFASGGWVFGPGTAISDSIPAMLSNGEFVVRAAQAKRFGPLLEAINDNKPLPKPLPNVSAGAEMKLAASSSGSGSGQQYIVGKLELVNGEAYITGLSQNMYDSNVRYENTVKEM